MRNRRAPSSPCEQVPSRRARPLYRKPHGLAPQSGGTRYRWGPTSIPWPLLSRNPSCPTARASRPRRLPRRRPGAFRRRTVDGFCSVCDGHLPDPTLHQQEWHVSSSVRSILLAGASSVFATSAGDIGPTRKAVLPFLPGFLPKSQRQKVTAMIFRRSVRVRVWSVRALPSLLSLVLVPPLLLSAKRAPQDDESHSNQSWCSSSTIASAFPVRFQSSDTSQCRVRKFPHTHTHCIHY